MVKSLQTSICTVQPSVAKASTTHTHPTLPAASLSLQPLRLMPEATVVYGCSDSNPQRWPIYATGGVKVEDVQTMDKNRIEDSKLQELISNNSSSSGTLSSGKLIQVSPRKNYSTTASTNTGLLVDLAEDDASPPTPHTPRKGKRVSYKEKFSYIGEMTSALSTGPNTKSPKDLGEQRVQMPVVNLLD